MAVTWIDASRLGSADTVVVGAWQDRAPARAAGWRGEAARLAALGDLTGREGEVHVLYPGKPLRLIVCGLGPAGKASFRKTFEAAARAMKKAQSLKARTCAFVPETFMVQPLRESDAAEAVTLGGLLAAYQYREYKHSEPGERPSRPPAVALVGRPSATMRSRTRQVEHVAAAVNTARTLANRPGNALFPQALAAEARRLARRHRSLRVTVWQARDLAARGYGALLAVGRGSAHPPVLIELAYRGGAASAPPIALVGKGVTFDSGGLCLKPSAKLDEMRYDMCGAAAVLGVVQAAADLRLPVNLLGIIPAAENLPSGTAYRPGDILTSLSGRTIEVLNTDAEGRLILADALTHAVRRRPACIVDLATLTGAAIVALGHSAAGLLGTDETLVSELRRAGEACGERVWPLPLWDEYRELLKSEIADLSNISRVPGAGTILGAAFLEPFTEGLPWAHLDIAGTAYLDSGPVFGRGATGAGVRLILEWLRARTAVAASSASRARKGHGHGTA